MKTLWQRSASTRTPPLPSITVEGIVLSEPMERHEHSRWLTLQTRQGELVRVVIANSAPVSNWLEPGQTIRVSGRKVLKQWTDGLHPTLSAHECVEILAGGVGLAGGTR